MNSLIIEKNLIELKPQQEKMIESGWGASVITDTEVYSIVYLSDGIKVRGYIAHPKNINPDEKFPCIIWNRGGALNKGSIDNFNARGMFGLMASWGYFVLATMYRGSIEGEGKEEFGGKDVNDVLNLMHLAEEFPFADTSCWGIEGWSRGGLMTYLALRREHKFKCAILNGAIADVRKSFHGTHKIHALFNHIFNRPITEEELDNRSPNLFADELPKATKYLLLHGGADKTISPLQTIEMAQKLSELGIQYRLIIFEGGDHFLKSLRKEVDEQRKNWYNKHLKLK